MLRRSTMQRRAHQPADPRRVEGAELVPLGEDDERVGAVDGARRHRRNRRCPAAACSPRPCPRDRRRRSCAPAACSAGTMSSDWALSRMSSVLGLKVRPSTRDRSCRRPSRRRTSMTLSAIALLARVVDRDDRLDDALRRVRLARGAGQRQRVLGEARAAEARAGMQELAADAAVEADAARHVVHVGADLLAEIGDLVDEGDLGREEGVGRVLDQLGGLEVGEDDRRLDQIERPVERGA